MSTKSHSESSMSSKLKRNTLSKMSDDGDDEVDEKGVIKRKSRNLSEKKRRDQFNVLINELCSMVCTGKRKMDKSTVLKSAISFIRNHNQVAMQSQSQEVQEDWKPSFLSNEEFTHLMLEALDGFIMVFASTGKILYVSENITCLLGHAPSELIGSMIYDLVWEEEQTDVQSILSSWAASDSESHDSRGKENHLSLTCHIRRGNSYGDDVEPNYELVSFSGYYRIQGNPDVSSASRISSSWGDDSKGSSSFGDALAQYNGLVFVASARLQTPQLIVEMSLVDVSKSEFTSRHSLEWKFLFLDHRGPPIIGYLPFEVLGTSGYDYYHIDDLEKVSACHEALMQKGEGTSCCYRFLTKGQQWIWLQTKYYITYHQWNSKPEFIVCSHRVVSHNEVIGHPLKEAPATKSDSRHSCAAEAAAASVASTGSSYPSSKNKPDQRLSTAGNSISNNNNSVSKSSVSSPSASNPGQSALSNSNRSHSSSHMSSHSSNRERSKHSSSKYSSHRVQQHHHHHHHHHHQHQHQHQQQSHQQQQHQTPSSGASDIAGESGILLPPPAPPGGNDTMGQHSRHPSGSSRGMGATLSDTGSISSSGSFQSAASQHSGHSRQSDQSMQSLHSQQSHHSMQSIHSQPSSQHSQSMRPNSSSHSCSSSGTPQHQSKQQLMTSSHQQAQQVHYTSSSSSQYRNVLSNSPRSGDETFIATSSHSSMANAGHRFLQPRSNSTASVRRNSSNNTTVTTAVPSPVSTATGTFTYQSVLPIGVADGSQGVTLPVQRIIEGLPVVTLPAGLVTHEPIVMTTAQRQLHEQLRVKHAQLQRQIMAQQEELRRVSEQLLLAQYGAWGSTVLKMTVPFSEGEGSSTTTTQPTHHAVLSAGGLVTCLTTESSVGLAQTTSPQLGNASGGQAVTFSPGTPILVHSPEIHAHSPSNNTEPISMTSDPSQVVFRTALQQDTLVQLSQQDVQMLLAQSLFQDNQSLSIEYLP